MASFTVENANGEATGPVVFRIDAPSIIRLVYLVKRPFLPRKLSKKEVFLRDRFTCQYCGKKAQDLTLDHVLPKSHGGARCWKNIVTACKRCNAIKDDRTPEQAGMKLVRKPFKPAWYATSTAGCDTPDSWKHWLK